MFSLGRAERPAPLARVQRVPLRAALTEVSVPHRSSSTPVGHVPGRRCRSCAAVSVQARELEGQNASTGAAILAEGRKGLLFTGCLPAFSVTGHRRFQSHG